MATTTFTADRNKTVTIAGSGATSISLTGTDGITVTYNSKGYKQGESIPLDNTVTTAALSASFPVSVTEVQNMKSVQLNNEAAISEFPATVNITAPNQTLKASGMDSPVITIDYTNTTEPTVTDTPAE
jgi:hypothetical protein